MFPFSIAVPPFTLAPLSRLALAVRSCFLRHTSSPSSGCTYVACRENRLRMCCACAPCVLVGYQVRQQLPMRSASVGLCTLADGWTLDLSAAAADLAPQSFVSFPHCSVCTYVLTTIQSEVNLVGYALLRPRPRLFARTYNGERPVSACRKSQHVRLFRISRVNSCPSASLATPQNACRRTIVVPMMQRAVQCSLNQTKA